MRFVDDNWEEIRSFRLVSDGDTNLPIATQTEAAFVFRNLANEVVRRYCWPGTGDIATLATYLTYLATPRLSDFGLGMAKGKLIRQIFFLLRLLSKAGRTDVNVLEVGATLGENFTIIKSLIDEYSLKLRPAFVGVEVSPGLCNFARMANQGNADFHMIAADGSDLSRFPDQSFDIVICQGVANFTDAPKQTLRELMRVTRFACSLSLQVTNQERPYYLTDGEKGWVHFIPTRDDIREAWAPFGTLYDYTFDSSLFHEMHTSAGGSHYYLGQDVSSLDIRLEWHVISRFPLGEHIEEAAAE